MTEGTSYPPGNNHVTYSTKWETRKVIIFKRFQKCLFGRGYVLVPRRVVHTVDGLEIPKQPPFGCIKYCKQKWDKLPYFECPGKRGKTKTAKTREKPPSLKLPNTRWHRTLLSQPFLGPTYTWRANPSSSVAAKSHMSCLQPGFF